MNTTPPELVDIEDDEIDYDAEPEGDLNREQAVEHARYAAYWQAQVQEAGDLYDAEQTRLEKEYQAKRDAITERREYEVGRLVRKLSYHLAHIEHYHRDVLAENPKKKRIDLVHGSTSATVYVKPRVSIVDKVKLVEWAEVHRPDLIERTARVPHAALEAAVAVAEDMTVLDAELGELVPGVEAKVSPPKFTFDHDPNGPF